MKLSYLFAYAIIMCTITIFSFRKNVNVVFSIMWLAYSVSAVFCVLCSVFQNELVGNNVMTNLWYDLSDTTLWGYLLIIICCVIAFRPFAALDKYSSFSDFGKSANYKEFFKLFSYAYIGCALVYISLSFSTVINFFQIDNFGDLRLDLYGNSENESTFSMTNNMLATFTYKVCLQLKYLAVFISLAMLKEKTKVSLAVALFSTAFFVYFLTTVANAARGGLMIFFFCTFLIGLLFFKYFHQKHKRMIIIFAAVLCTIVFSFFVKVTLDRFSQNMGAADSSLRYISFYLGHGPIEFSKITGSLGKFAMGDAIIGRLMNHYFGTIYSWYHVQFNIGYPPIGPVFTTYLGFIYTDFGIIGCLAFVTLWSSFVLHLVKKKQNCISTAFMLGYYMYYFVSGIFGIGRLEYAALITTLILYTCLVFVEELLQLKIQEQDAILNIDYQRQNRRRWRW